MAGAQHGRSMSTACYVCIDLYSMFLRFWSVEDIMEMADGPTGCGDVARGACLFA
jgi:hypothetical protein